MYTQSVFPYGANFLDSYHFLGNGKNFWDYYVEKSPEKIHNSSNAKVACDSFHKFKEDVKLVENLGVHFYRFSISWSRILPDGYSHNINKDGLRYYNDLINELIAKGKCFISEIK